MTIRERETRLDLSGIQALGLLVDFATYVLEQIADPGARAATAIAASRAIDRMVEPIETAAKMPVAVTEKVRRPRGQKGTDSR
jgi:hypothetical protein